MTKPTPEAPALPNASVDFNALHAAAMVGKAHEAVAPGGTAILKDEQAVTAAKQAEELTAAAAKEIADAAVKDAAEAEPAKGAAKAKPPADAA